jgi:site-specific DNA recombinase
MRAAIYVRLSRDTDESTSPERQRDACTALCDARGWSVVAVEEDIDVSGFTRGLDRPGLQRILGQLHDIDVIVFFKIDRLARSTVDFAEIMKRAEQENVALASTQEPLDLTSSMGRAMAKVIAVFAELEADTIGLRVSNAHEHLRREGRWTGGRVPYGYRVVDNPDGAGRVLEVNQDEAKVVREVVDRVLAKDSLMTIAKDLTRAGVPSPGHSSRQPNGKVSDSKQWYTTTLRDLLSNPQLLGQVIEDGKPILRTDGLPLVTRTPILDMNTWHALQDELARRSNPGERRREGTALLRGIAYCGLCHHRMYTFVAKGRERYRCIGRLKMRQGNKDVKCYGVSVAAKALEELVTAKFLKGLGKLPVVRVEEHAGEDFRPQIRQVEEALRDLEADRYDRGLFKGEDGAERYAARYAKLEKRLSDLNEMQRNAEPTGVIEVPTGKTFAQEWEDSDTAGRRDLLLNANVYVEVAPAKRRGKVLDPERVSMSLGGVGAVQRAMAEGADVDVEAVLGEEALGFDDVR